MSSRYGRARALGGELTDALWLHEPAAEYSALTVMRLRRGMKAGG